MEPNTMKAAVLTGPQEITVKSVPVPPVGPGELAIPSLRLRRVRQ